MRGVSKWKYSGGGGGDVFYAEEFNKNPETGGLQTIKSTNSAAAAGWS